MTKESIYELQRIDCNCNDCGFLNRLFDKQNDVLANNKTQQEQMFDLTKKRKIEKINSDIDTLIKVGNLIKNVDEKIAGKRVYLKTLEATRFNFQGDRTPIQYGSCVKFNKPISFITGVCQIETQKCFVHRKDYQA